MKHFLFKVLLVVSGVLLLDAFVFEKLFFQVKRFRIGKQRGGKRIKLLLVTDLHLKNITWPYYSRLARIINKRRPHLLLIAGDILDSQGKLATVNEFFRLLNFHIKKVAIPGNHDHAAEVEMKDLKNTLKQSNCDLLLNETKIYKYFDKTIAVTGLDDFIEGNPDVNAAMKNVGHISNHILMVHSPLQQETAMAKIDQINKNRTATNAINISYIFAGHNHGGQVRFMNYAPVLPEKGGDYIEGWYNDEKPYLFLSKGFGTTRFPVRFGARSEIVIFDYYV